jgi:hypothetical protein
MKAITSAQTAAAPTSNLVGCPRCANVNDTVAMIETEKMPQKVTHRIAPVFSTVTAALDSRLHRPTSPRGNPWSLSGSTLLMPPPDGDSVTDHRWKRGYELRLASP